MTSPYGQPWDIMAHYGPWSHHCKTQTTIGRRSIANSLKHHMLRPHYIRPKNRCHRTRQIIPIPMSPKGSLCGLLRMHLHRNTTTLVCNLFEAIRSNPPRKLILDKTAIRPMCPPLDSTIQVMSIPNPIGLPCIIPYNPILLRRTCNIIVLHSLP